MASIPVAAPDSSASSAKPRASAIASSTPGTGQRKDAIPSFGIMWTIMRSIGDVSLPFFFSSLSITCAHPFPPTTTPLIVCSNHSNTILDVAILASHMPDRRPLHFWAKAGFFANPITRFILTSSGNIKVDRRNKNNQSLFQGTFEAMKAGGAIALFPEGGSYTIPKLAKLKMGAGWAALEYSRYLSMQEETDGRTAVKIVPTAVVFDDKSVFRSRAVLRFGKPLALDGYIDEFLSSPIPEAEQLKTSVERVKELEDGTVPATPESMTRTNTAQGDEYATPAHRAVARLTADLEKAMKDLTFNAEDWETYQAVRMVRELIFELDGEQVVREDMAQYVELSRALMVLLSTSSSKSLATRRALFFYSSLLHLADVDNLTLARTISASSPFFAPLRALLIRLPIYAPIFAPTLLPTYLVPNALAHHYAAREEESLSSVKTLFGFFFTSLLYGSLVVKTMSWTAWTPPGLLVGVAGVWWLHELNRACVDGAYGLIKRLRFGWRVWTAGLTPSSVSVLTQKHDEGKKHKGRALFFYGTLVHPKILSRVIGNDGSHLRVQNAVLDGARLHHVKGEEYPGLVKTSAPSSVKGTLVSGLTLSDLHRLDTFEGAEYTRTRVCVLPDVNSPIEANSQRIANAGDAPLHAILSSLTPARIADLVGSRVEQIDAEVYTWSAGEHRLEDKVWQFDEFARTHAANWVGEGPVEHEHEYQLVDRIHTHPLANLATFAESTNTNDDHEGEDWVQTAASTLVEEGKVRQGVVSVCNVLLEKPSIQFYVDRAFPKGGERRPSKGDRRLLEALLRARMGARERLEELMRAVEGERKQETCEAVELLVDAKGRALAEIGASLDSQRAWPFTQAQVAGRTDGESKKTV